MTEQPGLPEWIATLVGRLVLENEALRQALTAARQPEPEPAANGLVPEREMAE